MTGRDVNELYGSDINTWVKPYFGKVYWGDPSEIPIGLRAAQLPRNPSEDIHEEHGDENAL